MTLAKATISRTVPPNQVWLLKRVSLAVISPNSGSVLVYVHRPSMQLYVAFLEFDTSVRSRYDYDTWVVLQAADELLVSPSGVEGGVWCSGAVLPAAS